MPDEPKKPFNLFKRLDELIKQKKILAFVPCPKCNNIVDLTKKVNVCRTCGTKLDMDGEVVK